MIISLLSIILNSMPIRCVSISFLPIGLALCSSAGWLGQRSALFALAGSQPIVHCLCLDQVSTVIKEIARQQEASQGKDEEAQIDLFHREICQCCIYYLLRMCSCSRVCFLPSMDLHWGVPPSVWTVAVGAGRKQHWSLTACLLVSRNGWPDT